MKRKIIILLIMTAIITLPVRVKALTGSVNITCDKQEILPNETITCALKGTSDENIGSVAAKISAEQGLTISNYEFDNIWSYHQYEASDNSITVLSENDYKDTFNIVRFNVSSGNATGTFKIYVSDIQFVTSSDYKEKTVANYEKTLEVKQNQSNNENPSNNEEYIAPIEPDPNTSGDNSVPSSNNSKATLSSSQISSNPQTGSTIIYIALLVGATAIGYSVWYYKKRKLEQ